MKTRYNILLSKGFLTGVFILAINDWLLKPLIGNALTGILSDLAGLFVFPIFLYALIGKWRKAIYGCVVLGFVFWKSPFSQPVIEGWNALPFFGIDRAIDYYDLLALGIIPFSSMYSKREFGTSVFSPVKPLVLVSSFLIFTATSYHKKIVYSNTFEVPFAREKVVEAINMLRKQDNRCSNYPLSIDVAYADTMMIREEDSCWFSVAGIDNVHGYPVVDTVFINTGGFFMYNLPVKKYMKESRTGYCECLPAKIRIASTTTGTSIQLIDFRISNCMGMFEKEAEKNEKENLLEAFRNEFINKLNK